MLRTSNSFARNDTGVVIDNEQHMSRMCKTSLLFAPLAVRVHTGHSDFPFYTPTKSSIDYILNTKLFCFLGASLTLQET